MTTGSIRDILYSPYPPGTVNPGDYLDENPVDATDVVYDDLDILMAALAARNLKYEVAVIVTNADVELPMFAGYTPEGAPILNVKLSLVKFMERFSRPTCRQSRQAMKMFGTCRKNRRN